MRELTDSEIARVSGGVLNLGAGVLGAGITGAMSGGFYAIRTTTAGQPFAWSTFAGEIANGATTGFLVGTGAGLVYAGATQALRGATVAGVSMIGAGGAIGAASAAASGTASVQAKGGGSE